MDRKFYQKMCTVLLCACAVTRAQGRSVTSEFPLATTDPSTLTTEHSLSRYERGLEDYDEEQERLRTEQGRDGTMMYYDHNHERAQDHDHDTVTSRRALKNDPWQGYYDFLINEGSFKFWAVFQIVTALVLIYSAFAAVYYAKYNFIQADYDYGDYFFGRSDSGAPAAARPWAGLGARTFQTILDAISSKKYS